jgi:hypothetical protein
MAIAADKRQPDGRFAKGNKPRSGRGRGHINKLTRDVKEGIIEGAAAYGSNGKGAGGLHGYFKMCARRYPKQYMQLLGRLLPLQIHADANLANAFIGAVNIISVPTDHFLKHEDIQNMLLGEPSVIGSPPEPPPVIIDNEVIDNEPATIENEDNVRVLNPFKDRK